MAKRFPDHGLDLRTVCDELGSVQEKCFEIGVQLGISRSKLEQLMNGQDPLSAVIDDWLQGNTSSPVTWDYIVDVLKSSHVGHSGLADRIQSKYCSHPDQATIRFTPLKNLKEILTKYASYVDNVRAAVQEKNVSVEDFKSFLLSLPVFVCKGEKLTLLADAEPEIMQLSTITTVFNYLKTNNYASFLDYELFKDICTHYQVGKNLTYSRDLREYCEKHRVTELAKCHIPQPISNGRMEEVTLKLDTDEISRIAKVIDVKRPVANALGLHPSALHIVNIQGGCVIITFLTPAKVAEAIFTPYKTFTMEQKAKFRAATVLLLKCKELIFPFGKEENEIQGDEDVALTGYAGNLTHQQETALQRFKEAVKDIPDKPDNSNAYYLRWLREKMSSRTGKFNVRKSEDLFRKHMAFRKKFEADTIQPPLFEECLTGGFFGKDLQGHPVWYDNVGNLDIRGIYKSLKSLDEIHKYKYLHSKELDIKLKEASDTMGKLIETFTIVIDLKNLSFQKHFFQPAIEQMMEVLKELQANNPERVKKILIVNAPEVFKRFYKVIKYAVTKKIRRKIKICKRLIDIQDYIGVDEMPQQYGGIIPDIKFFEYVKPGREVPHEYYLKKEADTGEEEKVVIRRRKSISEHEDLKAEDQRKVSELKEPESEISEDSDVVQLKFNEITFTLKDKPISSREAHQSGRQYVLKYDSEDWTASKELFVGFHLPIVAKQGSELDTKDISEFDERHHTAPMKLDKEWRWRSLADALKIDDDDEITDIRHDVKILEVTEVMS